MIVKINYIAFRVIFFHFISGVDRSELSRLKKGFGAIQGR